MEGVKNFTNIDDKDFVGMYGGETATVKAGKTVAFTEIIANHFAGQLAAKILIGRGKPWTDKGERAKLVNKILDMSGTDVGEDGHVDTIKAMEAIDTPKKESKKGSKGKSADTDEDPEAPEEKEFEDTPEDKGPESPATPDYNAMPYEDLKKIANEKGIDMKKVGRSKAKLVRALSK